MSETPTNEPSEASEEVNEAPIPEAEKPTSDPIPSKRGGGARFKLAFGSSVDLIKIGLLAIILAWGMRGIIGSFAQQGEAGRESYQVFHKELAVDQREAAEEDQLAKAEKQAAQLKIVNDLRSQAASVKEANHSIGEALEDWTDTIKDARDDAKEDLEECIEDADKKHEDDWDARRKATEECRIALARWCSGIDKDIIDAAETIIDSQTSVLKDLLDEETVERHWLVEEEDDSRDIDPKISTMKTGRNDAAIGAQRSRYASKHHRKMWHLALSLDEPAGTIIIARSLCPTVMVEPVSFSKPMLAKM